MTKTERAAHAAYMREYRQKHLEAMRAYDRMQSQKHKSRKLAYMAKYRATHAEEIAAAKKRCMAKKPTQYREAMREYYYANWEQRRAAAKAWTEKNKDKKKATDRAWYEQNRDRVAANSRAWGKRNPDKRKAIAVANRAARENAPGVCTAAQLRSRVAFYGNRCAYCGGPYEHLDHVIPVSRGGSNWPANLRPACAKCNGMKHSKKLQEWKAA